MKFDSVEQIIEFVNLVNKCETNMDLIVERSRVNAKSLIGVLSLDFTKPVSVQFDSHDEEMRKKLIPFMYKNECKCVCS